MSFGLLLFFSREVCGAWAWIEGHRVFCVAVSNATCQQAIGTILPLQCFSQLWFETNCFHLLVYRSQPYLGGLSFCQHPLSGCSLAKGMSAKEKGISQPRGDSWEGLSATETLLLSRHRWGQTGFNPFPVSHSFLLGFFPLLHKLQLRVKPLAEEDLWDPSLAALAVGCPCCPFTCSWEAALAGVSSSWLGWDELLCSCPLPQALYLAWVLSCSGAVWLEDFPQQICSWALSICAVKASAPVCHRLCPCCVTLLVHEQLCSSLAECFKLMCHLPV